MGVLTQLVGDWQRPVTHFSKQLAQVSSGWLGCLRAVPAAVLVMQEARKLTLVQKTTMHVPHAVLTAWEHKGRYWLAPSRLLQYQALLLEQDDITLEKSTVLNPASLMPTERKNDSNCDCLQVIEQACASRPDPRDAPSKLQLRDCIY